MNRDARAGVRIEPGVRRQLLDVERFDAHAVVVRRIADGILLRILRQAFDRHAERPAEGDRPGLSAGNERVEPAGRFAEPAIIVGGRDQRNRRGDERGDDHHDDEQLDEGHCPWPRFSETRVRVSEKLAYAEGSRAGVGARRAITRFWLSTLNSRLSTFISTLTQQMVMDVID